MLDMTMFSAEKRRFCGGYGGGESYVLSRVGSDLVGGMAEDKELRVEEGEEEWLQLSIGGGGRQLDLGKNNGSGSGSGSGRVELELMPSSSSSNTMRPDFVAPRPVFAASPFLLQHPQQEINWTFRPIPISSLAAAPSPSYFARPFQLYDVGAAPPVDFRVVPPPRRPHSGLWFMLQASHNQEREPFLPQISKSYLRIKDGRMTIRLVIKYLVNKLSLENESEIEIRCKGQRLLPFLTLQHVRDNIWSSPRDFITLLPNSSTTHHIMVLHYARTNPSN
ncbi:protein LAX PANICLE 2 [Salvia miltiorrhiza]|uniref:protein LAX PANICLE 2 n=1 Tax=Salvia miltiorrhiza TaxID=226208 RepID=UPI0025AC12A4|nr:protein LAX PANICLE 2 [Salvia miltiorrhiza]